MGRVLVPLVALQLVLLLISTARATPVTDPRHARQTSSCSTIRIRKEWRDMSIEQRLDYIRAVKCLQSTPSSSTRAGVATRFDEFQAAHIDLTPQIHQVGQFLPWHRHFLNLYDNALREECTYNGPAAFWDWSRDAGSLNLMSASPVFDENTGFGGNGVPGTYTPPGSPQPQPEWIGLPPSGLGAIGCVQTGPFKDMIVNLGPGPIVDAHCLVRGINEILKPTLSSLAVEALLLAPQFESFRQQLENGLLSLSVHNAGHGLVGGEMTNVYSSPGDPLFYLHHGNLDRIWWKWQNADPSARMYAISGNTNSSAPSSPQLTLEYQMPFTTLSTPVRVGDIMDTTSAPWCFAYDY